MVSFNLIISIYYYKCFCSSFDIFVY